MAGSVNPLKKSTKSESANCLSGIKRHAAEEIVAIIRQRRKSLQSSDYHIERPNGCSRNGHALGFIQPNLEHPSTNRTEFSYSVSVSLQNLTFSTGCSNVLGGGECPFFCTEKASSTTTTIFICTQKKLQNWMTLLKVKLEHQLPEIIKISNRL